MPKKIEIEWDLIFSPGYLEALPISAIATVMLEGETMKVRAAGARAMVRKKSKNAQLKFLDIIKQTEDKTEDQIEFLRTFAGFLIPQKQSVKYLKERLPKETRPEVQSAIIYAFMTFSPVEASKSILSIFTKETNPILLSEYADIWGSIGQFDDYSKTLQYLLEQDKPYHLAAIIPQAYLIGEHAFNILNDFSRNTIPYPANIVLSDFLGNMRLSNAKSYAIDLLQDIKNGALTTPVYELIKPIRALLRNNPTDQDIQTILDFYSKDWNDWEKALFALTLAFYPHQAIHDFLTTTLKPDTDTLKDVQSYATFIHQTVQTEKETPPPKIDANELVSMALIINGQMMPDDRFNIMESLRRLVVDESEKNPEYLDVAKAVLWTDYDNRIRSKAREILKNYDNPFS